MNKRDEQSYNQSRDFAYDEYITGKGLINDLGKGLSRAEFDKQYKKITDNQYPVISRGLAMYFCECVGKILPQRDKLEFYLLNIEGDLYRVNTTKENRNDFKVHAPDDEQWYGVEINDEMLKMKGLI